MLYKESNNRDIKHMEHWSLFCSKSFYFYCHKFLYYICFVLTASSILFLLVTFTIDNPFWNPNMYWKPDIIFYYSLGMPIYGYLFYIVRKFLKEELIFFKLHLKAILIIVEKDVKENKFIKNKEGKYENNPLSYNMFFYQQEALRHVGLTEIYNNCIKLIFNNKKWMHFLTKYKPDFYP